METKWFDYASFQPLPQVYPATGDKLKAFGVAVDKLGSLWDEQKALLELLVQQDNGCWGLSLLSPFPYSSSRYFLR